MPDIRISYKGWTAADRMVTAFADLHRVHREHPNDGDWHGCLGHALEYLLEGIRSSPPGLGNRHSYYEDLDG